MELNDYLNSLNEHGFRVSHENDENYGFEYEGLTFLLMYDESCPDFLRIALPHFDEYNDTEERDLENKLINRINLEYRYLKLILIKNALWSFFEAKVYRKEDIHDMIGTAVGCLATSFFEYFNLKEKEQENDEENQ